MKHLKVHVNKVDDDSVFVSGKVGNGNYEFYAKVEDEPSKDGINEGRVVKLTIKKGNVNVESHDEEYWDNVIINYDRAWFVKPEDPTSTEVYFVVLDELEQLESYDERIYGGSLLGKVIGKTKDKLSGLRGSKNGA